LPSKIDGKNGLGRSRCFPIELGRDLKFFVGGYWAYGATDKLISLIIWGYFCFFEPPGRLFFGQFLGKKTAFHDLEKFNLIILRPL
jgi:hypothetical protein